MRALTRLQCRGQATPVHPNLTLSYVAGPKSTVLGMAQARKARSMGALRSAAG